MPGSKCVLCSQIQLQLGRQPLKHPFPWLWELCFGGSASQRTVEESPIDTKERYCEEGETSLLPCISFLCRVHPTGCSQSLTPWLNCTLQRRNPQARQSSSRDHATQEYDMSQAINFCIDFIGERQ